MAAPMAGVAILSLYFSCLYLQQATKNLAPTAAVIDDFLVTIRSNDIKSISYRTRVEIL